MENHLIIGLGGTGGKIIRSIKSLIQQNYGSGTPGDINKDYLYLDTSNDDTVAALSWKYQTEAIALSPANIIHITGNPLKSYINNIDAYPTIKPWIGTNDEWGSILPAGEVAAGQKRRYGRFLLSCEIDKFVQALNTTSQSLIKKNTDRNSGITFHVCCGLAGGTGSGTIIDVVTQIRKHYPFIEERHANAIYIYALLPELTPTKWDAGTYHANGYAALKELNELSFTAYKPYDLSDTSGRSQRFTPKPDVFFNGCYVFTNQNENNTQLDVNSEVPDLAGTYIYKKIFSVTNEEARKIVNKVARCENGDHEPEKDEFGDPKRGRRFLTFGIKRVGIPEEEIKSYVAAVFSKQAALQLVYNRWFDGQGYTNVTKQTSFREYVETDENLKRWHLTEQTVTLSKLITAADKKRPWTTFVETWENKKNEASDIPNKKNIVRENWIIEAKRLFDVFYSDTFRGQGVKGFFELKAEDIDNTVNYIAESIEIDLFDLWQKEEFGLAEIGFLIRDLIITLERKNNTDFNTKIKKLEENEIEYKRNVEGEDITWNKVGWGANLLFNEKRKSFERQISHYELLCRVRTQIMGYEYAKLILPRIIIKLNELNIKIDSIKSGITESIAVYNKTIELKCHDAEPQISDHFVKKYDSKKVRDTAEKLSHEIKIQKQQSTDFRGKLKEKLGGINTFSNFVKKFPKERFSEILDQHSTATLRVINPQMSDLIEDGKKIFDISITERLKDEYENNYEGLKKFVRDLVSQASVFAKFNKAQEKLGDSLERGKEFMVLMPPDALPEGNNENSFNHKLKEAFMSSRGERIPEENIVYTETKNTEITLLNINNLFPLRYLAASEQLKVKYVETIDSPTESIRKRAKVTLHTEGDNERFYDLFPERRKEGYLPYIILADCLDFIEQVTNPETEAVEYTIVPEDKIYGKYVSVGKDILAGYKKCSFDDLDSLKKRVIDQIASKHQKISQKTQLQTKITDKLTTMLKSKHDNPLDAEFIAYRNAGKEAQEILKK